MPVYFIEDFSHGKSKLVLISCIGDYGSQLHHPVLKNQAVLPYPKNLYSRLW